MKHIHGDISLSYHQLEWYLNSLLECNPGSGVELEVDTETNKFRRVFICLEACIHGFKACRPLLFLDGTFLKGKVKGCVMAATGKNANQGMLNLSLSQSLV